MTNELSLRPRFLLCFRRFLQCIVCASRLAALYRFDTIIYDLLVQLYNHWARTGKSYVMSRGHGGSTTTNKVPPLQHFTTAVPSRPPRTTAQGTRAYL